MTNPNSVLSRDDERAAQAIALEVARRVKDRDTRERAAVAAVQQSSFPTLVEWRPHSLSHGGAGLAVLFEYLETCFPGQGWDLEARWHLEAAARSAEATPGLGIPLYGQLSGIAFAAWYLSRGGRRYRGLSTTLDNALFPRIEATADQLDAMSGGCPVQLFDLISGIAGAGVYLLCRSEHEGAQRALERILRSLVSLTAETTPRTGGGRRAPEPQDDEQESIEHERRPSWPSRVRWSGGSSSTSSMRSASTAR